MVTTVPHATSATGRTIPSHRAPRTTRTAVATTSHSAHLVALEDRWSAQNYHPLPVTIATSGRAAWVTDVDGGRYLDLLADYPTPTALADERG